ncbi:nudix hydrolase family protein [Photobacterium aphoticum]|uniref:Nudix hydrolase family protein n=1 Tax=Photobacterium aphoticum TaxID=754436 RepID=A0A090R865_9GAMM|nr:nudix hydrolase family protein [Photobacterium aphoticum]
MKHRIRAAGVLMENHRILLMRVKDASGEYYIPPGGGVEPGDISTKAALVRECLEETGLHVQVGELLAVREFHETPQAMSSEMTRYHAEFFYHIASYHGIPHIDNLQGLNDEHYIQAVEWVSVHDVVTLRTYPADLAQIILRAQQQQYSLHLGCYIQGDNDHINHL